jgi:hypothetical protein
LSVIGSGLSRIQPRSQILLHALAWMIHAGFGKSTDHKFIVTDGAPPKLTAMSMCKANGR